MEIRRETLRGNGNDLHLIRRLFGNLSWGEAETAFKFKFETVTESKTESESGNTLVANQSSHT